MALANLKSTSKSVTALIIVAVILFFGCILVYMAAAGKLKSAADQLAESEEQAQSAKSIIQKLEKSRLDYLDAKSQLRCLESSISTKDYVPTLLKQIEYTGKSVNLKVLGVRPQEMAKAAPVRKISSGADAANGNVSAASEQKPGLEGEQKAEPPAPYNELRVDLEVEGRYMDALDFLYKLTSFPKIIAVNSMSISPSSGSEVSFNSPALSIKINVTAFVFKDESKTSPQPAKEGNVSKNPATKGGTGNET